MNKNSSSNLKSCFFYSFNLLAYDIPQIFTRFPCILVWIIKDDKVKQPVTSLVYLTLGMVVAWLYLFSELIPHQLPSLLVFVRLKPFSKICSI